MRARRHISLYLDHDIWDQFQQRVKEMGMGLSPSRTVELMIREVVSKKGAFFADLGRFYKAISKVKGMLEKKK